VTAFCRQQGIPRETFRRWRRAAKGRSPGFVRVAVREPPATRDTGGARVTVVLRWATGAVAELAGLDASGIETLVRTLDALATVHRRGAGDG
jgi:hypothetical protein